MLFFGLVLVSLSSVFHPTHTAQIYGAYAASLAWAAYFGFASSQFSTGGRKAAWFKGAVAALLTQSVTQAAASLTALLLYR